MTEKGDFSENVREVSRRVGAYEEQAYLFVFEALEYTIKKLGTRRHVTGKELLEGIREFALINFGGMGKVVFHTWGLRGSEDFGRIVFALVDAGLMSKTETDTAEDFRGGFDFEEVFERRYKAAGLTVNGGGKRPKNA